MDSEMSQAGDPAFEDGADESAPDGHVVVLRGRYFIYPDRPLPRYDSPTAPAYYAEQKSDRSRMLVALLCDSDMPARTDCIDALRGYNHTGMVKVVDTGLVPWGYDERRRFVVVTERPGGPRVMPNLHGVQAPISEDDLVAGFLQPILSTLRDLQARFTTHRAIRPDNVFWTDESRKQMVLGECVTAAPAYSQMAVFETIESAMCHPTGRGPGFLANDLYSLGVTLLFMLLGRNPVANTSESDLLSAKIELGSYAALVGSNRISLGMMEPLRGLLSDDVRERWTVADLELWLQGRRMSPKQPKLPPRASRPFKFLDEDFFNARSLARAFAENFRDAANEVRGKALESWIRRSLGNDQVADALGTAVANASSAAGKQAEDRMVARVCTVLDPLAPIRYRGFAVALDGIGMALAAAIGDDQRRQVVCEIISSRLGTTWVANQVKPKPEDMRTLGILEKLPSIIDRGDIGYGVERALYELNQSERCLSPIFQREHVADLGILLLALEQVAQRNERPEYPIDRHIVAFVAARSRRPMDDQIRALSFPEEAQKIRAIISLLAVVQEQTDGPPVPYLCAWLVEIAAPMMMDFHHRGRRERIVERVNRMADEGMLRDLLMAIDDSDERYADQAGFASAMHEYRVLDDEIQRLRTERAQRDEDARLVGEQIAAAFGGLIVSIVAALTALKALI